MADTVAVPTQPTIPSIEAVKDAPVADLSTYDIDKALTQTAAQASAPLPSPYSQGAVPAQPYVKPIQPREQQPQHQPLTNSAYDIKHARRQNSFADLSNMVGNAVQKHEQQKQDQLKNKLVDVMQAKQNVHNAETVLSDPNADPNSKALAQKVFDANKKNLGDILKDPKNAKALAKSLDISYVDPEKNKTPEVQAGIAAAKEVKAAGQYNAANPQDAAVAKLSKDLQSTAPKPDVKQESRADAALAKDMPTIQNNPQYAAAVTQRDAAQKALIPIAGKIIDANSKALLQQYKDGNARATELFKATTTMQQDYFKAVAAADRLTAADKNALARVGAEGANLVRAINARAAATIGVTGDPRIDVPTREKLGSTELAKQDADIKGAGAALSNLLTEQGATGVSDGDKQQLTAKIKLAQDALTQLQNTRAATAQKLFPNDVAKQAPSTNTPEPDGFWSTLFKSFSATSDSEPVGNTTDQADDTDTDPDKYGNN